MTLNIWKASTLVLVGALVLVVGRSGVRSTQACDIEDAVSRSDAMARARIRNAVALLDRTQDQLEAVVPNVHTTRTIQLVSAAVQSAKRDLAARQPRPIPRTPRSEVIVLGE